VPHQEPLTGQSVANGLTLVYRFSGGDATRTTAPHTDAEAVAELDLFLPVNLVRVLFEGHPDKTESE
jgi:hypothetical protein